MSNTLSKNTSIQLKQQDSLANLADRFVEYLDVSELSVKSYKSGVRKFLTFLHCNGITTPTRDTVLMYKKELISKYSVNTTALYLSSIRRFFSWCESEGLYPNITNGIKSPKISHEHKRDAFSAVELKGIIAGIERNSLEGLRNYALFCLIASCGLRTVEAVRANVGDIHRVSGVAVLDIQGKGHSAKDAYVKLTAHVEQAIREYLKARGEVADNEPLFASLSHRNAGKRMTTRSISRICKQAMRHSGFDSHRLTTHSLRHTAVTLALMAGMSLQEVSQFARHSNVSVTMIYAHDVQRLKSRVESAISSAIFG